MNAISTPDLPPPSVPGRERVDGALRLYALATTIEQRSEQECCREAAREIALYALDLLAEARVELGRKLA